MFDSFHVANNQSGNLLLMFLHGNEYCFTVKNKEICSLPVTVVHEGVTRGARGNNSPGAESLRGHRKVSAMSQVLSSIQYSCFRKTSGSNMWAQNLFLAPGAI